MAAKIVLLLMHAFVAFTSCGSVEFLQRGPPVLPGSFGQAVTTPTEKEARYVWGEWTAFSPCSRMCGAGVRYRSRYCVKFSSPTELVTMPTLCRGEEQTYELCNKQTCGSDQNDFVDKQCAAYNKRRLRGRTYRWRVHRRDPSDQRTPPCALVCVADTPPYSPPYTSGVMLSDTVTDGTPCLTTTGGRGVCIRSQCLSIGCDKNLYSTKTVDRCGVCGGDNSQCHTETGTVTRVVTEGYMDVLTVPARARHILVTDVDNTTATFAVRRKVGSYLTIAPHTSIHMAGATFSCQATRHSGERRLSAQGPTNETVHIAMFNMPNLKHRYISLLYIYTLPKTTVKVDLLTPPLPEVAPQNVTKPSDKTQGTEQEYAKNNDTTFVENATNVNQTDTTLQTKTDPHSSSTSKGDYTATKKVALLRRKKAEYVAAEKVEEPELGSAEETPFAVPLQSGWYSQGGGSADDRYTDTIDTDTDERYDIYTVVDKIAIPTTDEDSASTETPAVPEQDVTTSEPFDNRVDIDDVVDAESKYQWKAKQTAPCSATCDAGVRIWDVQCHDSYNIVVDDDLCDVSKKPEHPKSRCDSISCKPKWLASGWSKCSVTCGKGQQLRNIRCWRMLGAGFKTSVHASLCATLVAPPAVRPCRQIDCGPLWEMSEWSQCSSYCDDRQQTRHIRCLSAGVDEACNPLTRPTATRACSPGTCDNKWKTRSWGECTGACDKGVQRRQVTCHGPREHLLHDKYCNQDTKPLSVKPCGDKLDCPAVWVPQDWGLCSAPCGDGVTRRHVICAHVISGQSSEVAETECRHLPKPRTFAPCKEKTCEPRWYMTEWSKCSKTCGGGGVRLRAVNCYDRKGVKSHSCSRYTRPEVEHSCDLSPCQQPTTSDSDNDDCHDSTSTSCHLVVDFLLCEHWFYKKACCRTCRDGANSVNDSLPRRDNK